MDNKLRAWTSTPANYTLAIIIIEYEFAAIFVIASDLLLMLLYFVHCANKSLHSKNALFFLVTHQDFDIDNNYKL